MNQLDKIRYKLAGETANPVSPDQAIEELSRLPDNEKAQVLDYLQTAVQVQHEQS